MPKFLCHSKLQDMEIWSALGGVLCPVCRRRKIMPTRFLSVYEQKTKDLFQTECASLFTSIKNLIISVSSQTISQWIKQMLEWWCSYILCTNFRHHYEVANWRRPSTFSCFYCRPTVDSNFSKAVLSALKMSLLQTIQL